MSVLLCSLQSVTFPPAPQVPLHPRPAESGSLAGQDAAGRGQEAASTPCVVRACFSAFLTLGDAACTLERGRVGWRKRAGQHTCPPASSEVDSVFDQNRGRLPHPPRSTPWLKGRGWARPSSLTALLSPRTHGVRAELGDAVCDPGLDGGLLLSPKPARLPCRGRELDLRKAQLWAASQSPGGLHLSGDSATRWSETSSLQGQVALMGAQCPSCSQPEHPRPLQGRERCPS